MEFRQNIENKIFVSVLGVNFKIGKFEKLGVCDEKTTDYLIDFINLNNTQTIIFDCSAIVYKDDQKVFERIFNHSQFKDRKILFFNLEDELCERMIKDLKNSDFTYISNQTQDLYFSDKGIRFISINDDNLIKDIPLRLKENDIDVLKNCSTNVKNEPIQLN